MELFCCHAIRPEGGHAHHGDVASKVVVVHWVKACVAVGHEVPNLTGLTVSVDLAIRSVGPSLIAVVYNCFQYVGGNVFWPWRRACKARRSIQNCTLVK